jgi:tetratricopeptide (TPR) repeat protein
VDEILNRLRDDVRQRPDDADAWYALAAAALDQGALEEAHEVAYRVLERAPDHREAHHLLAIVQERMGRIPEAIALWRRVVELSAADDVEALIRLGLALSRDGQHEEATRILTEVAGCRGGASTTPDELGLASIKGDLRTFNLLDVLEFLRVQGQSGALVVSAGQRAGVIHLAQGRVTGADAPGVDGEPGAEPTPLEETAVLGRIMAALGELLDWREGDFAFHGASLEASPALSFDLQEVMLQLVARRDETAPAAGS